MKTPNLVHQHTVPIDTLTAAALAGDAAVHAEALVHAAGAADAADAGASTHPVSSAKPPADDTALREGTRLAGYEVIDVIGRGGFGIVYLAFDHLLERHVAIKEYLPASLGVRAPLSPYVVPRSHRSREAFGVGLRSFINEARLLARFHHPALVKVLRFWEANGTAYMAMPYCQGPTLTDELAALGRSPDEDELRRLLRPLLDGLAAMHAVHCFHRDVAPDNILLTDDGPLLLDFGAARRVIGNLTNDLSAVVKPGYSPIEQYAEDPSLKQGPWTDLYALAAMVYAAVTGQPPQPSVDRLKDDRLVPLSKVARGRFSPALLAAIDGALALRPADRTKNVAEFLAMLDADSAGTGPVDAPREARVEKVPPHGDGRLEPAPELAASPLPEPAVDLAIAAPARDAEFTPTFEFAPEPSPLPETRLADAGLAEFVAESRRPPLVILSSAPALASDPAPESEFESGDPGAPVAEAALVAPPVGAIVTADSASAAAALPSWAREQPPRSRMPVYVLLGMSFVLVLAAIGYRLGSTNPPPMVSKLQPTPATRSAPAASPASASAALPSGPHASMPAPAAPPVATRVPASPPAVRPVQASASAAPVASRAQEAAATSGGAAPVQASVSRTPAASPRSSPDGGSAVASASKLPTAVASTPAAPSPAVRDGEVRAPAVAATSPAQSDVGASSRHRTPVHAEAPARREVRAQAEAPARGEAPDTAEAPAPPAKSVHVAQAAPPKSGGNRARCTEIIQSASLGPLNAGETAFLKRECHR